MAHLDHRPYSPTSDPYRHGILQHTPITPHHTATWAPPSPYPHLIKSIETFQLLPRWLFVRIETVGGVVGWGEATLEGHTEAVAGSLVDIARRLEGWDAMNIEEVGLLASLFGIMILAEGSCRCIRICIDIASIEGERC